MKVKICGITNVEDGLLAAELGAWALGFIFYRNSPRFIESDLAKSIVADIRSRVAQPPKMIGVFVNELTDKVIHLQSLVGLDHVQLHGDEDLDYAAVIDKPIVARRPKNLEDIARLQDFKGVMSHLLIDAAVSGAYGGTGHTSDWQLAIQAKKIGVPLILAGGIGADNIAEAQRIVDPFAFDLSSSVEVKPGKKSREKLLKLFSTGDFTR